MLESPKGFQTKRCGNRFQSHEFRRPTSGLGRSFLPLVRVRAHGPLIDEDWGDPISRSHSYTNELPLLFVEYLRDVSIVCTVRAVVSHVSTKLADAGPAPRGTLHPIKDRTSPSPNHTHIICLR